MTDKQMRGEIRRIARAARKIFKETYPKDEKIIVLNESIPYLAISLKNGKEYYFQGEAAEEILDEALAVSSNYKTTIEDALIWMADGW
jgi:hypothetical protein